MSKHLRLTRTLTAGLVIAACLIATQARAVLGVTPTSGNSVVTIDPYNQMGMNTWFVDGQNQLYQQWFWYRVGASDPENAINTLSAPVISTPTASTLNTTYTDSLGIVQTERNFSTGRASA